MGQPGHHSVAVEVDSIHRRQWYAVTHLGGSYQLSRAGGDFMGANHQLLELPLALHHQVGRIPAQTLREQEPLAEDWKHHWSHW